jgi:hypothetical protein
MAQVAAHAHVSHQTVSRVVNGSTSVRPATRERVEAAIRELGYRRNNAARTLVTSRSGLIGVIAVGSFLFGPTRTLVGIEEAARSRDFTTLLATIRSGGNGELAEQFEQAIDNCLDRSVESHHRHRSTGGRGAAGSDVRRRRPPRRRGPASVPPARPVDIQRRPTTGSQRRHLAPGRTRPFPNPAADRPQEDGSMPRSAERVRSTNVRPEGIAAEVVAGDWSAASGYEGGKGVAQQRRRDAVGPSSQPMTLWPWGCWPLSTRPG